MRICNVVCRFLLRYWKYDAREIEIGHDTFVYFSLYGANNRAVGDTRATWHVPGALELRTSPVIVHSCTRVQCKIHREFRYFGFVISFSLYGTPPLTPLSIRPAHAWLSNYHGKVQYDQRNRLITLALLYEYGYRKIAEHTYLVKMINREWLIHEKSDTSFLESMKSAA